VCYDSKGQLLWSVNGLPEFGEEPPLPPLVAADGTVYVLTNNPSYSLGQPEHRLRALREGRVLWERDLYSPAFQACGLGLGPDGTLYVAGALPQSRSLLDRFFKELPPELPHLLAFDPDGKVRWAGPVESWTAWARSCLTRGPNGVIYASCGQNSPHLTAFQADGRKLWDFRLPEPYDSQARIHGAPLVDEAGNLYLVCLARPGQGKGLICSVDPGGKLRWVRWLSDGASGRPALLREGRLWVEQNGGLTAYNSGSGEWEVDWPLHPNAEAPTRSLVADPAGNLYVNVSGDILALSREALRTSEAAGPESARIFSDEEWVEVGGVRLPRKPAEKL
jgi:outer membrane protein assembly factor BamB